MPSVPRFIRHMTGLEPLRGPAALDPDEAVALGAAVQAGMLNGDLPDMMIMDQFQVRQGRGRTGGREGRRRGRERRGMRPAVPAVLLRGSSLRGSSLLMHVQRLCGGLRWATEPHGPIPPPQALPADPV